MRLLAWILPTINPANARECPECATWHIRLDPFPWKSERLECRECGSVFHEAKAKQIAIVRTLKGWKDIAEYLPSIKERKATHPHLTLRQLGKPFRLKASTVRRLLEGDDD